MVEIKEFHIIVSSRETGEYLEVIEKNGAAETIAAMVEGFNSNPEYSTLSFDYEEVLRPQYEEYEAGECSACRGGGCIHCEPGAFL